MKQLTPAFLYPLTGVAALASLASCAGEKESQKPYNIVYIMTDDHTAQMMSCYGGLIETPNLDRIANDGVIFTNSFVANSLSGPSRACMLTGTAPPGGLSDGPHRQVAPDQFAHGL